MVDERAKGFLAQNRRWEHIENFFLHRRGIDQNRKQALIQVPTALEQILVFLRKRRGGAFGKTPSSGGMRLQMVDPDRPISV